MIENIQKMNEHHLDLHKEKLYNQLTDNINDDDIVSQIYDDIEHLENLHTERYSETIKNMRQQIKAMEKQLDEKDAEIVKQKINAKKLRNAFKPVAVFRAGLNKICNAMYDKYENNIKDLDYQELSEGLSIKDSIINNPGTKYAIARKQNKCAGLSIGLCDMYLDLNNTFHPKIKPFSEIIDSISAIKQMIKTDTLPEIYHITPDIVNEFEVVINQNPQLF